MDEDEYRRTYQQINQLQCAFEKALCSLRCNCSQAKMFRIADRAGVSCNNAPGQKACVELLNHLRNQTRFVFKTSEIDGPFPHNREIRVQNGGLLGLQSLLDAESLETVDDVSKLVAGVVDKYGSVENLPYNLIVPSIMAFKARPGRRKK